MLYVFCRGGLDQPSREVTLSLLIVVASLLWIGSSLAALFSIAFPFRQWAIFHNRKRSALAFVFIFIGVPFSVIMAAAVASIQTTNTPHAPLTDAAPTVASGRLETAGAEVVHANVAAPQTVEPSSPQKPQDVSAVASPARPKEGAALALPSHPTLTVDAIALDNQRVQLTIHTNLPMPIEVATEVGLRGLKPDDPWIGYDQNLRLTGATTVAILDTAGSGNPLPSATYDAAVDFVPAWGAKGNPFDGAMPRLHDSKPIKLVGTGGNPTEALLHLKRYSWVAEHIIPDMSWSKASVQKRLGAVNCGTAIDNDLQEACYFSSPEISVLVDRSTHKVITWRKGDMIAPPNATKAGFEARGLTWPLTVDDGTLGCTSRAVWFRSSEGVLYAVNGIAMGQPRFRDIDPIWSLDQKLIGDAKAAGAKPSKIRVDIGSLVKEGLWYCR